MKIAGLFLCLVCMSISFASAQNFEIVAGGSADGRLAADGFVKSFTPNGGWYWSKPGEQDRLQRFTGPQLQQLGYGKITQSESLRQLEQVVTGYG